MLAGRNRSLDAPQELLLWQGFYRIVLPLSGPGLAATAILRFPYSWNDFFFALILTRTEAMTAPVAVVNFMNDEGWEWGKIAAGGTMVMLPVLFFSILVRRFGARPDRRGAQGADSHRQQRGARRSASAASFG